VVSGKGDDTVIGRAVADKIVDPGGSDDQDTIFAGGGDDFISTFDGDGLDVVACDGGTNDKLTDLCVEA
jgi:hypothetical protein